MGRNTLNSHFTRQFRQEQAIHFGAEAMPCHHLLFQTFGSNNTDIRAFSNLLAPQLHDAAIFHGLQAKLTTHDIPDAERLYAFVQETSRKLTAQVKAEPYTSTYYNHLITLLHSFLDLIHSFTTNGLQMIACPATGSFADDIHLPANSEAVSDMYNVIEDYMYQIMDYFQHLDMLLQKESASPENNARIQVKSYVAHYLDTIIHHTEKLISNTDSTLEQLHDWETIQQNREEQELYN